MPNRQLRALLEEVGWTEDELARRVNGVAAESGLMLRLDRRSVTHWLAGRRPRPPMPALIAEAFSRGLRRTLTLVDIGLGPEGRRPQRDGATALGCASRPDAGAELTQLARFTGAHPQAVAGGAYRLALLTVPGWAEAVESRPVKVSVPEVSRLGPGQVATIESMVQVFSDSDTTFGGGRARAALMAYLTSDVAPWLRESMDRRLRRRLLSAATELTYLVGFMCFDDECHGLAQRYYRTALELATRNRDPAAYAVTLRAMSVQARVLGHRRHAEHLAEVAVITSRGAARPVHKAFFWGQLAVATAAADNRRGAVSALSAAERHLDQATSVTVPDDGAPMGGYHPAALFHQEAAVRALLGDGKGAITALSASIRHRPLCERRSRAILHARLAELHLDQGHLESAIAAWQAFVEDYPQLTSGRACTALDIMRSRLRPHGTHPAIRQLLARAAAA
ncbi:tetratricopeptide repeat protein [Actinomadura rudentiformis]|uniref:tetratricopeptide repeat protein n=1 Tax=Actinomadura rudentiformis TaxID=359158 RepID=UPI001CEFA421|nr:hypothetical protein [Actinomadura rudentiformis]